MFENVRYIHGGKFVSRGEWKHLDRVIDTTEIIIVIKGTMYLSTNGTEYTLTPGNVLRLDPGVRHYGTRLSTDEVVFYWFHFVGAEKNELPPLYLPSAGTAQAEVVSRQLLHYANTEGYPREAADCLLKVLIMELRSESLRNGAGVHRLCSTVGEWVRVNADLPIKVSDVAARFNYNEDYLNRVFRQFYPQGLKAYIDDMKMQKIKKDLIGDGMTLREISAKYAFSDYKYFLKYFKYHEGVSPTEYLRMYYNTHINYK